MERGSSCKKIDECQKIIVIFDKDLLDFQYVLCINKVCGACKEKIYGYC